METAFPLMRDDPLNPYQAPGERTETIAPAEPLRPPITPVRLALGLVLITICWAGIWLKAREGQLIGYWVSVLAGIAVLWVVDPSARKQKSPFKPREIPWVMVAAVGFVTLLIMSKGTWSHRWLSFIMVQPVFLFSGWLLSCAGLVLAWWKRRNNTPYQPESHVELPPESPGKPSPRQ